MDHAVPQGMDQGMDRGVWIVCGFGALIHTLYFDSYPYIYIYMKHGGVNVPQLATAKELSGHNSVHASPLTAWKF